MKSIRKIFEALITLRRIPSTAIKAAWENIKLEAENATNSAGEAVITTADITLIDSLMSAIFTIAKDDEDKAAASGKDGK